MKEKLFKSVLILILCLMLFPSIVFAARPLSTGDAGTVGRMHFEIESGFEYADATDNEFTWATALTYGLLEKLDIAIEIPYRYINNCDDEDGLGDITFSSKYHFLEESESLPAMAISFKLKTKTGNDDKNLGTGEMDYSATAILTKELNNIIGHKIIAHLNLGYTYTDKSHDDIFSYGVALEYPFNNRLNLVGELTGETANFEGDFDDNPLAVLMGFNYAFSELLRFDFGMGVGISEASPDYTITTGLTLSF